MKFLGLSVFVHLAAAFVLGYWVCPWIESGTVDRRGIVDVDLMVIGEKSRGAVVRNRVRSPKDSTSSVVRSDNRPENRPDAEQQDNRTETDNSLQADLDGTSQTVTLNDYLKWVREHNEAPVYPRLARLRGEQGRVVVRVTVAMAGSPAETVEVGETSGSELLDRVALDTARAWRFPPFRAVAPRITVLIPFKFALD